jgi:hypothetical protein
MTQTNEVLSEPRPPQYTFSPWNIQKVQFLNAPLDQKYFCASSQIVLVIPKDEKSQINICFSITRRVTQVTLTTS